MGFKTYNNTFSYFTVDDLNFDLNVYLSAASIQFANPTISLSPNPSSDFCFVNLHNDFILDRATIELRSLIGEVLIRDEIKEDNQYSIITTNYPSGMYFVRLNTRKGFNCEKKLLIVR